MRLLRVNTFLHIFPLKYGVVTATIIALLTAILECLLGVAVLKNPEAAGLEDHSRMVGILFILLSMWNLVLFVSLVRAMISKEPNYLRPWLIYMFLNVVLAFVDIVVSITSGQYRILFRLMETIFFAYLWMVVYSYAKVLQERQEAARTAREQQLDQSVSESPSTMNVEEQSDIS